MYIKKYLLEACYDDHSRKLLQILSGYSAEDRYYALIRKKQPDGAVGLPDNIEAYKERRHAREELVAEKIADHKRKLQHAREQEELDRQHRERAFEEKYAQLEGFAEQKSRHKEFFHEQEKRHRAEIQEQSTDHKLQDLQVKQYGIQMTAQLKSDIAWKVAKEKKEQESRVREAKLEAQRDLH
ncbi:hypothetical protein LTR66_001420 [Elasticomyces elasticus]|nr:hypothetical protein LTR66_001420 [Elasticomyces elasticus]